MSEDEAIERLKRVIISETKKGNIGVSVRIKDLETVLNMIKKENKIIDLMAEQLAGLTVYDDEETIILKDKEEVINYFKEEVENE